MASEAEVADQASRENLAAMEHAVATIEFLRDDYLRGVEKRLWRSVGDDVVERLASWREW